MPPPPLYLFFCRGRFLGIVFQGNIITVPVPVLGLKNQFFSTSNILNYKEKECAHATVPVKSTRFPNTFSHTLNCVKIYDTNK